MFQLENVSVFFAGDTLFEGISFTLQKGERYGLVGRNGSGKSTLLRLVDGEMQPDQGKVTIPKNYRIGYLHQHIRFTEETVIQEAAKALPFEEREDLYKAEKILFGLGFSATDLDNPPQRFSGGYQLRLHLAKVLISQPDCLLLDEPTNYLDIASIRWLKHFLSQWKGEFILISHDRDFMDSVTTHTMGIHRKKIKKLKGSSIDFFQQILLEEQVQEKARVKGEKKRAHMESYIERFGAKASKASQAQSRVKMLSREPVIEKLNQLVNLSFAFHEAPFPGKKMCTADHLRFSYNTTPLIENFSLEIEKGERIAIIGKNGRGKSTLLRLIGADLQANQGTIVYSDNTKIGYFGQTHVERLNSKHTIEEEIALANPALNYTEVKAIAGLMMFSGVSSAKKISVLSGGEKSRVLLGKIVACPCNLLLLDEPTHHLDIESIEALIDALEDFSGAIVIVTHSELILRRLALDKIILCEEAKQTLFLGNYDEFLEKIGWQEEEKKASPSKTSSKEDRKQHAAFILKRAAVLKPIEKKIQECEQKLESLEQLQKQEEVRLSEGQTSHDCLKSFAKRKKEIEDLENQLYELYELLETKKREFIF